ncbi:semaphorin-7A-like [Engraulis encrasicolus]|uniref:semaphorin-7A-like n=1 Tax=Engraulis encrasicolus TaxID=184585 RepID=UPI002FD7287A
MAVIHITTGVFLLFSISVPSDAETSHHARFKLYERDLKFKRGQLSSRTSSTMKLLPAIGKNVIFIGSGKHLSRLDFQKNPEKAMVQGIPLGCKGFNGPITVMQPGKQGYPLFVCTHEEQSTACCFKALNGSTDIGPAPYAGTEEPALLTEDALYTTQSDGKNKGGLYRTSVGPRKNKDMRPPSSRSDQRYVKVMKRQNKVYAFYTEKNSDQDPNTDSFTSKISRVCASDAGGSKDILQYQWTSQLIGRLSCGDPDRKLFYSELLDVAVLPSAQGESDLLYGLFRNAWDMTAVCAYKMDDIDNTFSTFRDEAVGGNIPGECVEDSKKLPAELLKRMKSSPEAASEVKPINNSLPLLVSHRHYSHIQVDRVAGTGGQDTHNVLLLSMESGAVHKVLENGSDPFIIAEYHPFRPGTHILSILLDSSEKKLYVGSSAEVVQIDLKNCSVYGKRCEDCILARDPYCGWDHEQKMCSPYSQRMTQDVLCRKQVCEPESSSLKYTSMMGSPSEDPSYVSQSSRHFLSCPVQSQHAEYRWLHDGQERGALMDRDQSQLVLLIEDMGASDQGLYRCVSSEGDYNKTVAQYSLRLSSGGQGTRGNILAMASTMLMFALLQ